MDVRYPPRLTEGDQIRVVAPSAAADMISAPLRAAATRRIEDDLGLRVTFGENIDAAGPLHTASVPDRVADLHAAFADPDVKGILTVIGGFHVNQLLPHLNYDLIAANPKVLCGFSDITALQNAILRRSGLVTYSGPHWSTFGMRDFNEPTIRSFAECVFDDAELHWEPSLFYTDDEWYLNQDGRSTQRTDGWWVLQPGSATGRIVGGNLGTFNLLQGTRFRPDLDGVVLFVEDDFETPPREFDRRLASLLQQTGATVDGLVIGRFQDSTAMSRSLLAHIVSTKAELAGVPVLANVDFGHTGPMYTYPIGGECWLAAEPGAVEIVLTRH